MQITSEKSKFLSAYTALSLCALTVSRTCSEMVSGWSDWWKGKRTINKAWTTSFWL